MVSKNGDRLAQKKNLLEKCSIDGEGKLRRDGNLAAVILAPLVLKHRPEVLAPVISGNGCFFTSKSSLTVSLFDGVAKNTSFGKSISGTSCSQKSIGDDRK